ncbi:hypothetical protein [Streptomyces xiaopingdaonensis]|uniref:hypothetical protein n=1 Tax=Streptomyces xiaopingdaonensis TaxID=1565415 RepID=UPI0002FE0C4F|nr:hypothetical protein [Streptomyces xiaopingdaonensis]
MNFATARRIGRTLALVLPVVLVLSGTLAVTRVPWANDAAESQVLTASAKHADADAKPGSAERAPQRALLDRLTRELHRKDPGSALTSLQEEISRKPSLSEHCASLAKALGRAAVQKYGQQRAQSFSRPVCDTSFATGVADVG